MIVLVGKSASGKTEVAKELAERYGIQKAITHTTRSMREGERQDVDYHFVSEKRFQELEADHAFVETTEYNGNHYGCSKKEIADDKCVVVDPNGLMAFLSLNDPSIITFYLEANAETRRKRMEERGDGEAEIRKRLTNDEITFQKAGEQTDYRIQTDELSIEEVTKLIKEKYELTLSQRR